jgi:hypothetical protein
MTRTSRKRRQHWRGPAGKAAAIVGVIGAAGAITVAARRARTRTTPRDQRTVHEGGFRE